MAEAAAAESGQQSDGPVKEVGSLSVRRRLVFAAMILSTVGGLFAALSWTRPPVFQPLADSLTDVYFPTGEIDPRIAVVELRGNEINWGRADHAALIRALTEAGAAAIGYDVIFDADVDLEATEELREAIEVADNVVLAASATLRLEPDAIAPQAEDLIEPLPGLFKAAEQVGHAQVVASTADQLVRTVPLLIEKPDRRLLPALSLAVATLAQGQHPRAITVPPGDGVTLPGIDVPTDADRRMVVNWAWRWTSNRQNMHYGLALTADEVLSGRVDLTGTAVFVGIGSTVDDCGVLRTGGCIDVKQTPVNRVAVPGVQVHAAAANTILTQSYRTTPRGAPVLAIFLMVGVVGVGGMFTRMRFVPVIVVLLLLAWQFLVRQQFAAGTTLDNLWPNVAVIFAGIGVLGARYVTQVREQRRVAGLFKQYVPDHVVDDLLASGRIEAAAEGERVEVTVLFSDLRGFTATAATLAPRDVRALLEVYYDHCTRIIHDHGGTVMQFVGDEVFAVFGAPIPQADHAQRALDAARAMQAAAPAVNAELADRGVSIAWGIGINTGKVIAAHVGSQVHKQYAVVGQPVNVGARLCSQAGPGEIVISRWTREALSEEPVLESLGPVALKGVKQDPEPARVLG